MLKNINLKSIQFGKLYECVHPCNYQSDETIAHFYQLKFPLKIYQRGSHSSVLILHINGVIQEYQTSTIKYIYIYANLTLLMLY